MIKNIKFKLFGLLKKTEKYTGTDNVYIAKGGLWLTFNQLSGLVILSALAVAWARLVPPEIYGQYKFVLSMAGLLLVFCLPGIDASLTQAVARGFDGTILPAIKTKFRWSVLAMLGGLAIASYYWLRGNQTLGICFLIAGLLSPILNNLQIYNDYLAGKKRFDLQAKYSLLRTLLSTAITLLVLLATQNLIYLILTYFAANAILYFLFFLSALSKLPPKEKSDPAALNFGKHLSLLGILGQVAAYIDKIIIFHYLGAVELAVYAFATMLPDHLNGFIKNASILAMPKIAASDEREIKRTLRKRTIVLCLAIGALTLLYLLFADLVFKVFFPAYLGSVLYSKIYILSLLGGAALIPSTAFIAKAKTKIMYQYNIVTNVVKIIALLLGLHFAGLMGLVIGYVGYVIVSAVFSFILFRQL
ncbi:MAG: oligosaccharide flippase family protein [Patescibacteria group bacterium]